MLSTRMSRAPIVDTQGHCFAHVIPDPALAIHLPVDLVDRPLLLSELDTADAYPVLLVVAPGGYSKTTTVASWLQHRQIVFADNTDIVWHNVTWLDNNLHRFCSELVAGICDTSYRYATDSVWDFIRTRQLLNGQEVVKPEHLAAVFTEDISRLPIHLKLVLDDYHELHDASVNAFIQSVLRRMPVNLQMLILTRKKLPFSVARLRSQNKLAEVSIQKLQLSLDESAALLKGMLNEVLSAETLTLIHQHAEGWAAGIRLIGLALRDQFDQVSLKNLLQQGRSIRYVSEFLMDEVLAQQPDEIQLFLLQTSLLIELDEAACAAVMDDEDGINSRTGLEHVVVNGLFVTSVPSLMPVGMTYRYHATFRNMLQDRLRNHFCSSEIAAIHHRIAAHMAKVGNIDFALQSWLKADAPDLAVAQVEAQTMALIDNEAWPTLVRYLSYLPESITESRPLLLLARIWICNMFGDFEYMRRLLDVLATLLSANAPVIEAAQVEQLHTCLALARLNYRQFCGPFPTMAEAEPLESAVSVFPVNSYLGASLTSVLSWVYSVNGEYERARAVVTDALESFGALPGLTALRLIHGRLIDAFSTGRLDDFITDTLLYYDLATQVGDPIHLIWANAICSYAGYLQNDDARAAQHARSVLEMSQIAPLAPLTFALVQIARLTGNVEAQWAQEQINEVRRHAHLRGNTNILSTCNAIEAWLMVHTGKVKQGLHWAHSVLKPDRSLMLPLPTVQLCWLRCMAQSQNLADLSQAQQLAEKLMVLYQRLNRPLQRIELGLIQICIHLAQDNQQAALDLLVDLVPLAVEVGFTRPIVDAGALVYPLLQQLAKRPQLASAVLPLLSAVTPTSSAPQTNDEPIQFPGTLLTARERQILDLLVQGMTNHDIAQAIYISPNTVRNHVVNILNKLGVNSRQEAVAAAFQLGMVQVSSASTQGHKR